MNLNITFWNVMWISIAWFLGRRIISGILTTLGTAIVFLCNTLKDRLFPDFPDIEAVRDENYIGIFKKSRTHGEVKATIGFKSSAE